MSAPTVLRPGDSSGDAQIIVTAVNAGSEATDASPITIVDQIPAELTVTSISSYVGSFYGAGNKMTCNLVMVRCVYSGIIPPYGVLHVFINVRVAAAAAGSSPNTVSISGGGAGASASSLNLRYGDVPAGFGIEHFDLTATNKDGSPDLQAGSHPYQLTTSIGINQQLGRISGAGISNESFGPAPAALTKDLSFELPPGLVGNPTVVPQCSERKFATVLPIGPANECPPDTAIGVAVINASFGTPNEVSFISPVFNLTPRVGEPARFGFTAASVPVYLDTAVRTGSDYGVTVRVSNIPQAVGFDQAQLSFWGTPGDPSHDPVRGWACVDGGASVIGTGEVCPPTMPGASADAPFLTLPTSCTEVPTTTAEADSWQSPGSQVLTQSTMHDNTGNPRSLTGCNRLGFSPSIQVSPDGQAANTPTGLSVDVHVPQDGDLAPDGLAESEVRSTTVALPAGIALSPAAADGLLACGDGQGGLPDQIGLSNANEPSCPDASKVATVEIDTPLLPNPLRGEVYLASQNANPFGSLLAMYIVAKDPASGVLVKLPGQVTPDAISGQLTATFKETPQLPFSDLKVDFFGSARAPLSTPPACGAYTTSASISPWSGQEPALTQSTFEIKSGPDGTGCADPQPFDPSLTVGTTNIQAGGFSPLTLTMTRPDADQPLGGLSLQMPSGLLGTLTGVPLCPEPQASKGECGEQSMIGHTIVSAGLGGDPFTVAGGQVFLTGPYKGAPFGLSILNPAKAGPFDLGTVVVRAAVNIDAHTAALTVTSDPLPTIIDGIPLQLQHVNVTIDRTGFIRNPTNCSPLTVNATLSSSTGALARASSPFQVTNCASLGFKPGFSVSTSGKTSKAAGASLDVKLVFPPGANANVRTVKVDLPKQLPSRLTTLQTACLDTVFNTNPAACPTASRIGVAKATTPVVPVTLQGPVYFVSHGGAAFPDLVVILEGYGIRVDLVAATFISNKGVTSSTFKAIPDVPVSSFELYLPQGKHSALAVNVPAADHGSLCGQKLMMPTAFSAQNGKTIHESTKIAVSGCPRVKAKSRRKAAAGLSRRIGHRSIMPRDRVRSDRSSK